MTRRRSNRPTHTSLSDTEESDKLLSNQLSSLGLKMIDCRGDGNCMFRALSHQLLQVDQTEQGYAEVRARVCQEISQNSDNYKPFISESFDLYLERMQRDKFYGGNIELVAFSRAYNRNVYVFQVNSPPWLICGGDIAPVRLALHSYEHYSSVVDAPSAKKTSQIESMSNEPTKIEKSIMQTTKIDDLQLVRNTLRRVNGNVHECFNVLFDQSLSVEPSYKVECPSGKDTDSEDELVQAMTRSLNLEAIPSPKKKPITRMQQKREKREKKRLHSEELDSKDSETKKIAAVLI
jgi:hypothetical protein